MKKELTYQEFLNLSENIFAERNSSLLEIFLYAYNKTAQQESYEFHIALDHSMHTIGEYVNSLQLLKNMYTEVLPNDYLDTCSSEISTTINSLFSILNTLETVDDQSYYLEPNSFLLILDMVIQNLDILTYLGYDLEKIYLS